MATIDKIIAAINTHGAMTSAQLVERLPAVNHLHTYLSQYTRRGRLEKKGYGKDAVYSVGTGRAPKTAPPPAPQDEEEGRAREARRQGEEAERERQRPVRRRHHARPAAAHRGRRPAGRVYGRADERDRGRDPDELRGGVSP